MALAGLSEWKIQVFGRWVGSSVLKYIRDTSIDVEVHHLAEVVVNIDLKPIQRIIAAAPVEPAPPRPVQQLALESLVDQDGNKPLEELAARYAQQCTELSTRIAELEGRSLPSTIGCRASRKAHKVANALTTLCGWAWSAQPLATLQVDDGWKGGWCKVCVRAAGRSAGGA